jgi:hypothetical protein
MNFKFILVCLLFLVSRAAYSQKQIRNANWGWSKDSVKKSEKLKLIAESKDALIYSGTLANKEFDINYQFIKNKLTEVYYMYSETHVNSNNYIYSYDYLKEILIKKYDQPLTNDVIWKNDLYKDDKDGWGIACSAGHVVFKTIWETDDTTIILICTGENFKTNLAIVYKSRKFQDQINKDKDEQNVKDF